MRIKEGTKLELAVRTTHGSRKFPLDQGCASCAGPDNQRSNWLSLEITEQGQMRGVPKRVLLNIDIPLDEFGQMFSNGGHARGIVGWTLDGKRRKG